MQTYESLAKTMQCLSRAEAERDRQYEYNIVQIAKQAELEADVAQLKAALTAAEQENAELRARCERLCAPVTHDEAARYSRHVDGRLVMLLCDVDALLAARKDDPRSTSKGESMSNELNRQLEGSLATLPAPQGLGADIEKVLIGGDLSPLNPDQRLRFYNAMCQSLGLNPLTKPFAYIVLNGKLQLYALKDCTEQLRKIHGVSITQVDPKQIGDLLVVVASACDRENRVDSSTGAVAIAYPMRIKDFDGKWKDHPKGGKQFEGEDLANAMMKAETKAKRRVTLSLCGLGMLDETEVDTLKQQGTASEPPSGNLWQAPPASVISHPENAPRPTTTQQTAQQVTQRAATSPAAAQPQAGQVKFIPPDGLTCVVKGVQEVAGQPAVEGKRAIRPYLIVTFLGMHNGCNFAYCFDTKFWELLKSSVGLECHFQIKERDKDGTHFVNLEDVLFRDGQEVTYIDGKLHFDGNPAEVAS